MGQFERPFEFYLQNQSGDYYYEDGNGDVQTTSTITPLQYAPTNWQEMSLSYSRSRQYWGLWRKQSEAFTFYKDGHNILSYIFANEGAEGYCKIIVKRWDMANVGASVSQGVWMTGELDFSQAIVRKKETQIPIMQGGIRDLFSAYENTSFEIPIEDFDSTTIRYDGIDLFDTLRYTQVQTSIASLMQASEFYVPVVFTYQDGSFSLGSTHDPNPTFASSANYGTEWFFQSNRTQTITLNLSGTFYYELGSGATDAIRMTLRLYQFADPTNVITPLNGAITSNTVINSTAIWVDSTDLNPGNNRVVNVSASATLTLTQGNILVLVAKAYHPNGLVSGSNWGFQSSSFPAAVHTLQTSIPVPLQDVKAYGINTVFSKLVDKVTNGTGTPVSTFFGIASPMVDALPARTYLTSGTALKGLDNPKLKMSFADYWRDTNSQWCLGLSVDEFFVRLEKLSYFFDATTEIISLPQNSVKGFSWEWWTEAMYSTVKAGYQDQEYDGLNGRYEVNTTHTYKLPTPRATKTLDLIGAFRYDPVGAETYILQKAGRDTTDDRADNEIFAIEVNTGGFQPYYPRRQQNIGSNYANDEQPQTTSTGAFWAKWFNGAFTPARKLLRNAPHLLAAVFKSGGNIEYLATDKNENYYSDLGSGLITESDNYATNAAILGSLVYMPVLMKITCILPYSIQTQIENNPTGYIEFEYNGFTFQGFPMEVKFEPKTSIQSIELLAVPATDLDDLRAALL